MQAIYVRAKGLPELVHDHPRYEPGMGWARIRMLRAGICGTDLELLQGYKDFNGVPGHEFVGVVEESPSERSLEGKRVCGEINVACGDCAACNRGHPTHCQRRRVLGILGLDGAFAENLLLPLENLHVVPDGVSDEEAVFVEPLAAALEILEQVHIHPGDTIYVLGAGKLGLLTAQVLRLPGCDVTLIGRRPDQLELARGWGLQTYQASSDRLPDLSPADVVVDCTGRSTGLQQAVKLVRPRGTVVMKTTIHGLSEWRPTDAVVDEVTMVGSRCGPFPPALRLLDRGLIHVRPLVAAVYPLREGLAALEHAGRPGVLKVMLAGGE